MADAPWIELLNSDWHDYRGSGLHKELIDDPAWLGNFLAPWKADLGRVPLAEVQAALKALRRDLRAVVGLIASGRAVPPGAWRTLNQTLAEAPIVRRIEKTDNGYALPLIRGKPGLAAVLGEIVSGFGETLSRGELERIKICDNQDCRWVFYDRSKNRSRRWCEGNTGCGNMMKVRLFRARKKRRPRPSPA